MLFVKGKQNVDGVPAGAGGEPPACLESPVSLAVQ
jgi:hypothetical protein